MSRAPIPTSELLLGFYLRFCADKAEYLEQFVASDENFAIGNNWNKIGITSQVWPVASRGREKLFHVAAASIGIECVKRNGGLAAGWGTGQGPNDRIAVAV